LSNGTHRQIDINDKEAMMIILKGASSLLKSSVKTASSPKRHHCQRGIIAKEASPEHICYSHWPNGAGNGVISIGQWGVFNHEKGSI
jgi:hypothetical protein